MIEARVATLLGPRDLRLLAQPLDPSALAPGEILGETIASAISPGTELAAYVGAPPLKPGPVYPRVVGYCNVARIVAAGPGTADVRVGDRVLTFQSHRSHFRMRADEVLAVLDSGQDASEAACAYLFHLGYNATLKAGVRAGSVLVVIGLGVLGLAAVACASIAGARVFAISDDAGLQRKALAAGANRCFLRTEVAMLATTLGQRRAHSVITTSNRWADWPTALELAGAQGTIAVLGFPGRQEAPPQFNPFDPAHFYHRQLRIIAAGMSPERPDSRGFQPFNERDNLQCLLTWLHEGRLDPGTLLSGRFPAHQLRVAYEQLLRREDSTSTFVLDWSREEADA